MEFISSVQWIQLGSFLLGAFCMLMLLKFLFKIFKTLIIAIIQTAIGILEFLVNSLRGVYNLFVAKENKLLPVVLVKINPEEL